MSEAAGRYRRARAANLRHVVGWPDRAVILPRLYTVTRLASASYPPSGALLARARAARGARTRHARRTEGRPAEQHSPETRGHSGAPPPVKRGPVDTKSDRLVAYPKPAAAAHHT